MFVRLDLMKWKFVEDYGKRVNSDTKVGGGGVWQCLFVQILCDVCVFRDEYSPFLLA